MIGGVFVQAIAADVTPGLQMPLLSMRCEKDGAERQRPTSLNTLSPQSASATGFVASASCFLDNSPALASTVTFFLLSAEHQMMMRFSPAALKWFAAYAICKIVV